MLRVNGERLIADLRRLSEFGKCGSGVTRTAFSDADIQARQWLAECFRQAGLEPGMDAVGNVYGRSAECARALLIGSHTDTVPTGGWLDGSLGVIFGLEIARRLREEDLIGDIGVDVVSFQDEEGTFLSWLGSRWLCGEVTQRHLADARNPADEPLTAALAKLPEPYGPGLSLDRYIAYFESHIEQGPVLERTATAVGIVASIVGIRNKVVQFRGRADHAGTTPMSMRCDAAEQMFDFVSVFRRRLNEIRGEHTVWNFGNASFLPGASNVVPQQVELLVQYRDPDSGILKAIDSAMEAALAEIATAHGVANEVREIMSTEPVLLDQDLGEQISLAAADVGVSSMQMPSGAGHDAAALGKHIPSVMLFAPSIGGRSHTFDEDTSEADIVAAADVALNAARRFLEPRQTSRDS